MAASNASDPKTERPQRASADEARSQITRVLLILNASAAVLLFALMLFVLQSNPAVTRAAAAGFFLACLGIAFALVGGLAGFKTSDASESGRGRAMQWRYAWRLVLYPSLLSFVLAAAVLAFGTWLLPRGFLEDQGTAVPAASAAPAIDLVIGFFVAVGTIAVALLAIWGESARRWALGPRLRLEKVVHKNEPEWVPTQSEWYFHLRVENTSSRPAVNCCVRLRRFERLDKDGKRADESFVVPLQYCWPFSAAGDNPTITADPGKGVRRIVNNEVIDFGSLKRENGKEEVRFRPWLYAPSDFCERAFLSPGDTGWYHLEIISDEFTSRICQVFKVEYSEHGWTVDKNEIRKHLKITEETGTDKET
ncbi:MAG: hypothetical protein ABIP48_04190 [Planctomycetota bacterium]